MTRAEESAPQPRPKTAMKQRLERLIHGPAVFPLVFVLGFVVTFGVGSVAFLGGPDLADLVRQGKTGPVIRALEQREKAGDLDANDALVLGHAYAKRKDHGRMIGAYKRARAGDIGDDEMLENLLQTLVLEDHRAGAIEVLRDWSDDDHVSARLKAKLTDDAFDVRHAALSALSTHVTTPEHRDLTVRVGVKDIEIGVGCVERKAGVDAIRGYVRDPAVRQVFVETNAFNVVLNNLKGSAGVDCIPAAVIDDVYNGLGGGG